MDYINGRYGFYLLFEESTEKAMVYLCYYDDEPLDFIDPEYIDTTQNSGYSVKGGINGETSFVVWTHNMDYKACTYRLILDDGDIVDGNLENGYDINIIPLKNGSFRYAERVEFIDIDGDVLKVLY